MSEESDSGQRKGYRGYTTHQRFGGLRMPAPVQDIVLRHYADRHNLMFVQSADEYDFPNCYVQLNRLITQLERLEGILMCSAQMLPKDSMARSEIYSALLQHGGSIHLVLDRLVVSNSQEFEYVEELLSLSETLQDCPASIPDSLMPLLPRLEVYG